MILPSMLVLLTFSGPLLYDKRGTGHYKHLSFPLYPSSCVLWFLLYEKLNHRIGQVILATGPCPFGTQTFSASLPPFCWAFCSLLQRLNKVFQSHDRKGGQEPKQNEVYCTKTPSEHQPRTIVALPSTFCVVTTVTLGRKGREPAVKSSALHSIPRHKDNRGSEKFH